ncbi:MAG: hypothetical protein LBU82_03755, partial [Treponema sp.]|nr:hypothetical protein [Treponema sp.]
MKKAFFITLAYIFLFVCGSVHGIGEKTIVLGGKNTWKTATYRAGVAEVSSVRPFPVLVLSSATGGSEAGYSEATGVYGNYVSLTES